MQIITIIIAALLSENYVLVKFLGICPFLGVSKRFNAALGTIVGKETHCSIVTDGTYKARAHTQVSQCQHRITSRTSRSTLHIERRETFLDTALLCIAYKGHTPRGQTKHIQQFIILCGNALHRRMT